MSKNKYLILMLAFLMASIGANAQSYLERMGQKALNRAKERVEQKVEQKVDDAVDKAVDDAFEAPGKAVKKKNKNNNVSEETEETESEEATPIETKTTTPPPAKTVEATYAKCDFVSGDEIIFDDPLINEQMGEFPSMWDLKQGNAEIAKVNGQNVINLVEPSTIINPLMKDMTAYLQEAFTLEYDFFGGDQDNIRNTYITYLEDANGEGVAQIAVIDDGTGHCFWNKPSGENSATDLHIAQYNQNDWNHFALSFNKRALKVYVNGTRVANIPNCARPVRIALGRESWDDHTNYITNIRICNGAVPLYNRLTTDGKIVTYAITFDLGRATIKPESMAEISRIQKLMQDDPSLKFEIQGHCDNTGSATTNDKLSQQRAEAIKAKLESLGIASNRLTAVGKGSREPLADNSTDEGRARNRRVEFVKK